MGQAEDRPQLHQKDQRDPYWSNDDGPATSSSEGPVDPDHVAYDPPSNQKIPTTNPLTRKRNDDVSYVIEIDDSSMTGVGGSGAGQPRSGKALEEVEEHEVPAETP